VGHSQIEILRRGSPCCRSFKDSQVYDPRTTEYIDRRMKEGKTKKEAVRCLKRYVAREVYGLLPHDKIRG
jgi:hypothetical protein